MVEHCAHGRGGRSSPAPDADAAPAAESARRRRLRPPAAAAPSPPSAASGLRPVAGAVPASSSSASDDVVAGRGGRAAAGFDATSMKSILEGAEHGSVLRPGYPEGSMLMTVIRGEHPEVGRMPPGKSGPLTDAQIEAVRLWIEQGAVWSD